MRNKYSEAFLAKWLENNLSREELEEFEKSPDFELYKKIATKSTELKVPSFNKERLYQKVQIGIENKKGKKVRSLFFKWSSAAAAAIILITVGIYYVNQPVNYTTSFGEQLAIQLPDNSEVILNANAKISYDEGAWNNNRTVFLEGEAYFKVKKGITFKVKTATGDVKVLGTRFNVKTQPGYFEVYCYEGSVEVDNKKQKTLLTRGNAYREIERYNSKEWIFKKESPTWIDGESSFESTPLHQVIKALENQYKININTTKVDVNERFTGSFIHNDLALALQLVFDTMKIETIFTNNKKTILLVKQ